MTYTKEFIEEKDENGAGHEYGEWEKDECKYIDRDGDGCGAGHEYGDEYEHVKNQKGTTKL